MDKLNLFLAVVPVWSGGGWDGNRVGSRSRRTAKSAEEILLTDLP
jgi:hypothetical protein